LQSFPSHSLARLNPAAKVGKYSGGVKSEILNATEEKVSAEIKFLHKMIFTEKKIEFEIIHFEAEKVTNQPTLD